MAGKGRGVRLIADEQSANITVRIPSGLLTRIDTWRSDLDLTRSEAIRQALELFFGQK